MRQRRYKSIYAVFCTNYFPTLALPKSGPKGLSTQLTLSLLITSSPLYFYIRFWLHFIILQRRKKSTNISLQIPLCYANTPNLMYKRLHFTSNIMAHVECRMKV